MPRTPNRDISRPLQSVRNFLLGRKHTTALRNANDISPKTQPQPCLPYGPHAKYAQNYYCEHDARREVKPPTVIKPCETVGHLKINQSCYNPDCKPVECPPPSQPPPSVCDPCSYRPECVKTIIPCKDKH